MSTPPRYAPARRFPAHAFVPGKTPRPAESDEDVPALDADRWEASETYRWGVDLYNAGYYWEAHEAWEQLWRKAAAHSPERALLQGLIQCAAAALQARAGRPAGLAKLTATGTELLEVAARSAGDPFLGVEVAAFVARFRAYAAGDAEAPPPLLLSSSALNS